MSENGSSNGFYERVQLARHGDSAELQRVVAETVVKLGNIGTSASRPGVLFGRIQSGKTRAFLGIIAEAFDNGFDGAIVLTKGTKSLVSQTMRRMGNDFGSLRQRDLLQFYDIMDLPSNLTQYVLNQKLVLVVKKEDDNLKRLQLAFEKTYPSLQKRKWLIVDDEADLASITFRRVAGEKDVGKVSKQIDLFRKMIADSAYLQVTATPYALYLQPEEDVYKAGELLFRPRRPAFTEPLPSHDAYVGGDYYFDKASDDTSPAYYFYEPVPLAEREALKKEDGRRLKLSEVLSSPNSRVIRQAIMNFIVGGTIRRMQQIASDGVQKKYAFLFHTEQTRSSHQWQEQVVITIRDSLTELAHKDAKQLDQLIEASYADLERSLKLAGSPYPTLEEISVAARAALADEHLMVSVVNSDKDVESMLDDDGQLLLQNPFNIFIGGQILDRGITISNLIGFYYGRNPQKTQQDTVLQHSRMYGARDLADLPVTRLYAPERIYKIMKTINTFDAALRDAIESKNGETSAVYFLMQDSHNKLVACSPNKILFSDIKTVRPGRRLVPTGFNVVSVTAGKKNLEDLDAQIAALEVADNTPKLVDVELASRLLELAQQNQRFDDEDDDDRPDYPAILHHLSHTTANEAVRGKVWLLVAGQLDPRNVGRERESGRLNDSPDTKQQSDAADSVSDAPVLMLLKQRGDKEKGWSGLPFWWPVIVVPKTATTAVFAERIADTAP
jgi:hypothetical protein